MYMISNVFIIDDYCNTSKFIPHIQTHPHATHFILSTNHLYIFASIMNTSLFSPHLGLNRFITHNGRPHLHYHHMMRTKSLAILFSSIYQSIKFSALSLLQDLSLSKSDTICKAIIYPELESKLYKQGTKLRIGSSLCVL